MGELALVTHQRGDLDTAARMYRQSLDICREFGSIAHLTTLLVRLAALEEQRGNTAIAFDYAREALEWSRKLGMVQERAQAEAIVMRLGD